MAASSKRRGIFRSIVPCLAWPPKWSIEEHEAFFAPLPRPHAVAGHPRWLRWLRSQHLNRSTQRPLWYGRVPAYCRAEDHTPRGSAPRPFEFLLSTFGLLL